MIPTTKGKDGKLYVDVSVIGHPDDRFRLNDNRDAERYRKLKSMRWSVIRVLQDRAKRGEDFDKLVDEYEPQE